MLVRTMALSDNRFSFYFWVRSLFSLLVLSYLFYVIDWRSVKQMVPNLKIGWVGLAFCAMWVSIYCKAVRWSVLLARFSIRQTVRHSFLYYLIGLFYGFLLPGILGSDAVRIGMSARQHLQHKSLVASSVLFERFCGLIVILLVASFTVLVFPEFRFGLGSGSAVVTSVALFCSLFFFFFFAVLKFLPYSWLEREGRTMISRLIYDLFRQFRDLKGALLFFIILTTFAAQCLDIVGSYFLARSLGIERSLFYFFIIMPLVYACTILPISLGGLGVREGVLAFFLVRIGVLPSHAVLLGILLYLSRICVSFPGCLVWCDKCPPKIVGSKAP